MCVCVCVCYFSLWTDYVIRLLLSEFDPCVCVCVILVCGRTTWSDCCWVNLTHVCVCVILVCGRTSWSDCCWVNLTHVCVCVILVCGRTTWSDYCWVNLTHVCVCVILVCGRTSWSDYCWVNLTHVCVCVCYFSLWTDYVIRLLLSEFDQCVCVCVCYFSLWTDYVTRLLLSEFEAALSDRSPQNLLKSTTVSALFLPQSDTLRAVLTDLETNYTYLLTYCFSSSFPCWLCPVSIIWCTVCSVLAVLDIKPLWITSV